MSARLEREATFWPGDRCDVALERGATDCRKIAMSGMTMANVMSGAVFLSYRREDTANAAGRLGDRIALRTGRPVFVDVDSIAPGADFIDEIERAIGHSVVLLAFIGPRWTTFVDDTGRRRLDDPDDVVVLEIRTALRRNVPVIPVLVDGASMPTKAELPADLQALTRRNAVVLDTETFTQDSEWLIQQLVTKVGSADAPSTMPDEGIPCGGATAPPQATQRTRRALFRLAAGAVATGATGASAWAWLRSADSGGGALWSFETGGEVYSSPTVDKGVLFVGSNDQHLYALDARAGQQIWRYATNGAVTSSPMVSDDVVYVGSNDAHVHAVNAATGKPLWKFQTAGAMHSSPMVKDGTVYIGCRDHNLYAINSATGHERWHFAALDWFNSSPLITEEVVYVGCRDTNVYALDALTGEKRWSYTTGSSVDSSPTVSGGTLWIGSDDHRVYALNARTGAWIWDFDANQGVVSSPFVAGDVIYVGSDDGNLYALDASTGRERWRYSTANGIRSSPTLADGVVYVGSRDFSLHAVDAHSGAPRWQLGTRAPIDDSTPLVFNGVVYVGSLDHRIYAVATS